MPDINYLNPTSLSPKFGWEPKNALAGMQWEENKRDYRSLFDQQLRLQAMAEEQRRMELEEKKKDIPLNDLKRQGQMEFTQGQNPYQRELGASGAQAQTATNQIQASPERKAFEIDKFKQGMNDNQWANFTRSMSQVEPLVSQALNIAKTQGPMAAQQWMSQVAPKMKAAGADLPDYIMNPQSWEPLRNAAINTAKHQQEMEKVKEEGMYRRDVAEINGGYGLQQGRERNAATIEAARIGADQRAASAAAAAKGRANKFSTDQKINDLMDQISTAPEGTDITPQVNQAAAALGREFEKMNAANMTLARIDPRIGENFKKDRDQYIRDRLKAVGIDYKGAPVGKPTPGGSTPERKPLGSFD